MLVGSAGSGRVGFSSSSVSFGFISDAVILAESVEIWPDHDKISPDLNEISPDLVGSGLDLDKISSDLVQSYGFQVNFCQITSNITGFCMFLSKNLRILPKFLGL